MDKATSERKYIAYFGFYFQWVEFMTAVKDMRAPPRSSSKTQKRKKT